MLQIRVVDGRGLYPFFIVIIVIIILLLIIYIADASSFARTRLLFPTVEPVFYLFSSLSIVICNNITRRRAAQNAPPPPLFRNELPTLASCRVAGEVAGYCNRRFVSSQTRVYAEQDAAIHDVERYRRAVRHFIFSGWGLDRGELLQ